MRLSPLNVRTCQEDAEATSALEASISANGLIQRLEVHPFEDTSFSKGGKSDKDHRTFGVFAGGRRFRAIGKLIARGELPEDWPIDVKIRGDLTDAQITELSLSENILRRDLRPWEIHSAIATALDQGATAEEIAERTGQSLRWVRQQLRLGQLAPEIFAAYAAGDLAGDTARAFAATADQDVQRAAWAQFQQLPSFQQNDAHARQLLKVGDREHERLLAFVGDVEYRAKGGRFELDLFADGPERGRVVDEGLLRELAEKQFGRERSAIRLAAQNKDLAFASEPPTYAGHLDHSLEIHPRETKKDTSDWRIFLPDGQVFATLALDNEGHAEPRFWWASRKAKGAAEKAGKAPADRLPAHGNNAIHDNGGPYGQKARAAVKEEHGFTGDGLQIVRSLRRALLRSVLMAEAGAGGTLARDYLHWSMLRQQLGGAADAQTGARGLKSSWDGHESEPVELVRFFLEDEPSARDWDDMVEALANSDFMQMEDPAASLDAYLALPEHEKTVCATLLAGFALLRSANAPGWQIATHDHLAQLAGADDAALGNFWKPDARFLGLLPKMKRLELAQPHVGEAEFASWHKLKDKVLTGACAGALEHAAEPWIHPLLSFGADQSDSAGPEDDDEIDDPNVNDEASPAPAMEAVS